MLVFGDGGTTKINETICHKKNAMQLMHGMGNMFNFVDTYVIEQMWYITCERLNVIKSFKIFSTPSITRWWTVGASSCDLLERWNIWYHLLSNASTVRATTIPNCALKIMRSNRDLMNIPELQWDIAFFAALHKAWIFPHFSFLQKGDCVLKSHPGFQGRLMTVRFYFMTKDLMNLRYGMWKESDEFKTTSDYMTMHLPDSVHQKLNTKAKQSFRIIQNVLDKHFTPWINRLAYYSVFGDVETATIMLRHMLRLPPQVSFRTPIYYSATQKRYINLYEYQHFVQQICTRYDLSMIEHLLLSIILEGYDIWDKRHDNILDIRTLRNFYTMKMASAGTITHNAERGVKLGNQCSDNMRNESLTSEYAVCSWRQWKESYELAVSYHLMYGVTNRRKKELTKNESMRYKSASMGLMQAIKNVTEDNIKIGEEYAKHLKDPDYSYILKRNNETTKFSKSFAIEDHPTVFQEPDDTPLVTGLVRFSDLRKSRHTDAIVAELINRQDKPSQEETNNCNKLTKRLKINKGNRTVFKPTIEYERFIWWDEE